MGVGAAFLLIGLLFFVLGGRQDPKEQLGLSYDGKVFTQRDEDAARWRNLFYLCGCVGVGGGVILILTGLHKRSG